MDKTTETVIKIGFSLSVLGLIAAFLISLYYLGIISGKLCQCSCGDELAQFSGLEDDLMGNITIKCKCMGKSLFLDGR